MTYLEINDTLQAKLAAMKKESNNDIYNLAVDHAMQIVRLEMLYLPVVDLRAKCDLVRKEATNAN